MHSNPLVQITLTILMYVILALAKAIYKASDMTR